jgi:hypothetical protein
VDDGSIFRRNFSFSAWGKCSPKYDADIPYLIIVKAREVKTLSI